MNTSRRQLVAGIASLPIVAAVPVWAAPLPVPVAFAPIATALKRRIVFVTSCAEVLVRHCHAAGLPEAEISHAENLARCAEALPDAVDPAHYRPEAHALFRYQLITPLTGLCGFAGLLIGPRRDVGCSVISRLVELTGLEIAHELVPQLYQLQTGETYPPDDAEA